MIELKSIDLPADFLREETRDGFFVDEKRKQVWAVELDLFAKFVSVCIKYNLKYYADAGTLLGAVRHQGFIPWDDDMDFVMFRNDYDRLCDIGKKEFKHPYYFQSGCTDLGTMRGHIQIRNSCTTGILLSEIEKKYNFNQGIFIDVFPMDYLPDASERKEFWRELYAQKEKCRKYIDKQKDIDSEKLSPCCFDYQACIKRYADTKASKMALLSYEINNKVGNRLIKDYENYISMPFEFMKVNVPAGYRNILRIIYGSWKEKQRACSEHRGVLFDVDRPYYEYLNDSSLEKENS